MKDVARGLLEDFVQTIHSTISATDLENLATLMLDKAEGVFLWLRIVIDSLQRGLNNPDCPEVSIPLDESRITCSKGHNVSQ
jgi:hypothetical protein